MKMNQIKQVLLPCIVLINLPAGALNPPEKIVVDYYAPSQEFCRAIINPDVYIPSIHQTERDIACLVMGFRDVISINELFMQSLLDKKHPDDQPFEALRIILQNKINSKQIHILKGPQQLFLYSNTGKENARLLVQQDVERIANPYLYGFLLGYREGDINFFYKMIAFQGEHAQLPHSSEFYFWPPALKNKFYDFEKRTWPRSDIYKKYHNDKMQVQKWIRKAKLSCKQ
jgi:hypothetical protein